MRPKEYTSIDMFCIQLPSLRAGQIWGCFALYCCLCSCESLYALPSFLKQALPKSIITAVLSDITTLSSFISLCKFSFLCMYFKPLITPINIDFQSMSNQCFSQRIKQSEWYVIQILSHDNLIKGYCISHPNKHHASTLHCCGRVMTSCLPHE